MAFVKFGAVCTVSGEFAEIGSAEKAARLAEEAGLDSFLVWDHYMLPHTNRTLEAYTLLAYLAGKTEKIKLGTCVTPLPFRHPAVLAKIVSTLDVLSGGRVIVGVGAGWHRPEFEGYSRWGSDAERVERTEEALKIMINLWTRSSVSFEGKHYRIHGAVLEPKPVQKPYPPLWFGTAGRRMLGLAVKYGSGWIPVDVPPPEYREIRDWLAARVRRGFVFANVCWSSSSGAEMREKVERFAESGCDYYLEVLERSKMERQIEWMAEIAEDFR